MLSAPAARHWFMLVPKFGTSCPREFRINAYLLMLMDSFVRAIVDAPKAFFIVKQRLLLDSFPWAL